jgi:CheY-like chemotaxis protein
MGAAIEVSKKGELILIADDDPDIILVLETNLRLSGFDVITARDGETALRLARMTKPRLLLLDIMMPNLSGIEVLSLVRDDAELRDTKVILMTGLPIRHGDFETHLAEDLLQKPIDPRVVVERIAHLLGVSG